MGLGLTGKLFLLIAALLAVTQARAAAPAPAFRIHLDTISRGYDGQPCWVPPRADGREIVMARHTQAEQALQLLLDQRKLTLPAQGPPKIQTPQQRRTRPPMHRACRADF